MTLLATKLHMPVLRTKRVLRPRLVERLDAGAHGTLTLVSAPAGFGKTTAVSEWLAGSARPSAWLSLDADDSDPARFLSYFIAALQEIHPNIGQEVLRAVSVPQPPPIDALLAPLINEIAGLPDPFTLVLDDYHAITSPAIDRAMALLLERAPAPMHIVMATREDPDLPLHRLRARGQLSEVRAADLRFTSDEAAGFLTHTMALRLSSQDVAALETRTEGWVAGLQLAALSMQGMTDTAGFIKTFAGSHRYILDYLLEEVLHKQPAHVQDFLLRTSILGRLCGALCDAVLDAPAGSSQAMLESLEQANLFITALDNERKWFRYHHLFGELLRQRLQQRLAASPDAGGVNALHGRASQWFEDNGFDLEAFHQAAAAGDVDRAERLIDGKGIPLHLRGAVTTILNWLDGLPAETKNARPALWWRHAALLLVNGHTTGVEEKLNAAEAALQRAPQDDKARALVGPIATARATLALTRYQPDVMLAQSEQALQHLPPDRLATRANAWWTMGYAHYLRKNHAAARNAFSESIALSERAGEAFPLILATTGLGGVQEAQNELHAAAETYRRILQIVGDQPLQIANEPHHGLARICYEWNDLAGAEHHAQQGLEFARQYESVIDRFILVEITLARVKAAQGDAAGALALLEQAAQSARQRNFLHRLPEIAAAKAMVLIGQSKPSEAMALAQQFDLPLCKAQALLAQGDPGAAIALLDPMRQQAEANRWPDEALNLAVLHAVALHRQGDTTAALAMLATAMTQAAPEGFIRTFVDKGPAMARLLSEAMAQGVMPAYCRTLLAAFEAAARPATTALIEPLSPRELDVLRLIAQGLSNNEISERLFLALDTVKGHNRRIFEKLGVQRRTEAVARARELGLL
jgi:LuxR family maltose regulon positive regulatory protein